MCYSAEAWSLYDAYVREFGPDIEMREFWEVYLDRDEKYRIRQKHSDGPRIPKGMDLNFLRPKTELEQKIHALIQERAATRITECEQELFKHDQRADQRPAERVVNSTGISTPTPAVLASQSARRPLFRMALSVRPGGAFRPESLLNRLCSQNRTPGGGSGKFQQTFCFS